MRRYLTPALLLVGVLTVITTVVSLAATRLPLALNTILVILGLALIGVSTVLGGIHDTTQLLASLRARPDTPAGTSQAGGALMVCRIISASCYFQEWSARDLEGVHWPFPPWKPFIVPGSCRRFFVVLEFAFVNQGPTEVTIGPFRIAGWMFEDRWTPPMYSPIRDYRVFDLYTRQATRLDFFFRIPPNGTLGFRVEALEDTSGPGWESSKSRYQVDLPSEYRLEYNTDVSGRQFASIPLRHAKVPDLHYHPLVRRWSELLGDNRPGSAGTPMPQGFDDPR